MRTSNSIKNIKYNIVSQILSLIVQFVSRTVFIKILGKQYLGISGLFSNILTILSLADMGIGTVLVYSMYKPLALNDEKKLKQLMSMYKKIYNIIALIVLCLGLCITPFLEIFIGQHDISNIHFIFILYLINTVVSYLCVYKISIINADQKNYIVTIRQQIINLIANIVMIMTLLLTHNFIVYLIFQIFFSISSNIYISKLAEKMYPFITNINGYKLSKEEQQIIKKDTFAMLLHKIGGVVVAGTDSILMSMMIGLDAVGIYSNYLLIINAIKRFTSQFFSSISASVGNLNVQKDNEYTYTVFKRIFFGNFWIFAFCSLCLFSLLNPFINLWIGKEYTFSINIVFAIVLSFYVDGMRQTVLLFRDSMGIFTKDKMKPIIEAIVNLLLSIVLTVKFGIIGIILGTILSMLFVCVYVEARVLFKYGFKKSGLEFLKIYLKYFIISFIAFIIICLFDFVYLSNKYVLFGLRMLYTIIMSNIIIIIFTYRTDEFRYFLNLILKKIGIEKVKKNEKI